MRPFLTAAFFAAALPLAAPTAQAQEAIRIELNAAEPAEARCRLTFLLENKGASAIETLKLDLAVFNPEGVIQRRLAVELGPLRKAKTALKAFEVDTPCTQIGSILVNDVTACAPPDAGACLDALTLESRPKGVRFYK